MSRLDAATSARQILSLVADIHKQSILFFDVDHTLIAPISDSLCVPGHLIDRIKSDPTAYPDSRDIISAWRLQRKVTLVDQDWPYVLSVLQKNHAVYALTQIETGQYGRILSQEQLRAKELTALNLVFSQSDFFEDVMKKKAVLGGPSFFKGIFFCGNLTKKDVCSIVYQACQVPSIVLIDDLEANIQQVDQFCQKEGILFHGILFRGIQQRFSPVSPQIVALQKKHLMEKRQWIEDQEALALLEAYKKIPIENSDK